MAQIKKIEIICIPCHKCEVLEERVLTIMQCLQFKYSIRMQYKFMHYDSIKEVLRELSKCGYGINNTPITLINGEVAFVGHVKGESVIRIKLEEILRS